VVPRAGSDRDYRKSRWGLSRAAPAGFPFAAASSTSAADLQSQPAASRSSMSAKRPPAVKSSSGRPDSITRPRSSTITRSASRAVANRCAIVRTALPRSRTRDRSAARKARRSHCPRSRSLHPGGSRGRRRPVPPVQPILAAPADWTMFHSPGRRFRVPTRRTSGRPGANSRFARASVHPEQHPDHACDGTDRYEVVGLDSEASEDHERRHSE